MTLEDKRAYTEVFVILENLNLIDNLPKEIITEIKNKRAENYYFTYDKNVSIESQKISKKAMILLSTIYIAYICDDNEEKQKLKEIYDKNKKRRIEASKLSNILKDKENRDNQIQENNTSTLVPINNENILKRVLSYLKRIFGHRDVH